jgi:hypothetical protein
MTRNSGNLRLRDSTFSVFRSQYVRDRRYASALQSVTAYGVQRSLLMFSPYVFGENSAVA